MPSAEPANTLRIEQRKLPDGFFAPASAAMPAVLARVYAARGGTDRPLSLQNLLPLQGFSGLDAATRGLAQAIAEARMIVVVGDFDADGATGTAVAVRGLRMLGATQVSFRVPNRFTHGYGLSPALVDEIADTNPGCLLLTVDQGTSSVAGVARAKQRGLDVIVSDHHLPGDELPNALAIVNPNLTGETFASKNLCGVGTVFYLLLSLRAHFRAQGDYTGIAEPALVELLDLVALGTVADLVSLDFNNRVLVEQGLKRMRAGAACLGIRALLSVAGVDIKHVSASDLAFRIAPRLNAAGRMDDMAIGIQCLLCDEPSRARAFAESLSQLNRERRELQEDMQQQALTLVERRSISAHSSSVLVVADEEFHQGIVGLVASKLVERFHRPAIALAKTEEGWRGSARSIAGLHLRDALAELDTQFPNIMLRFGGHAMAAGLTLHADALGAFRRAAEHVFSNHVTPELLQQVIYTDGELTRAEFTLQLAQHIRLGGPWGQQFPEPLFEINAEIIDAKRIAGRHLKLRLNWQQSVVSAIWFNTEQNASALPTRARFLAQVNLEEYQGLYSPSLLIRHLIPTLNH